MEDLLLHRMEKQRAEEKAGLFKINFYTAFVKALSYFGLFASFLTVMYFQSKNGKKLTTQKIFGVLWYLWQIMKIIDHTSSALLFYYMANIAYRRIDEFLKQTHPKEFEPVERERGGSYFELNSLDEPNKQNQRQNFFLETQVPDLLREIRENQFKYVAIIGGISSGKSQLIAKIVEY